MRSSRVMAAAVALLALVAVLSSAPVEASTAEASALSLAQSGVEAEAGSPVRAVWVARHRARGYNEARPISIQDGVDSLAGTGFNRLYWDSYTNGQIHFACPECNAMVGSPIAAQTKGDANDQLSIALAAAQGKVSIIAWFEYSFLVQSTKLPSNPVYLWAKKNNLMLLKDGKEFEIHHHLWLDPRKPQSQAFVVAMMCAALKNYPTLGGVQQDDHLAFPVKGVGAQSATFTTIVKGMMAKVRACAGKGQILSLAPSPIGQAKGEYNVDWHSYGKLFDEYVPQTYLSTAGYMAQVQQQKFSGMPAFIPAIAADHGGKPEPWSNIQRQLNELKAAGLGVSFWCDIAVRSEGLRPGITKYFGGKGPSPRQSVPALPKVTPPRPTPTVKSSKAPGGMPSSSLPRQPKQANRQPMRSPPRLFRQASHKIETLKQRAAFTQPEYVD